MQEVMQGSPAMPGAGCRICAASAETVPSGDFDRTHQKCPRCGEFRLSGTAVELLQGGSGEDARVGLSGWIRDRNRDGTVPILDADAIKHIAARPLPSVAERAERLLLEALHGQGDRLDLQFNMKEPRFVAATYSQDTKEVSFLIKMLSARDLVEVIAIGGDCGILPEGYAVAAELSHKPGASGKAFVAMSSDDDAERFYEEGFQPGILNAGYDPVHMTQSKRANRADDRVMAHIRAAAFVVADFTGHRGGVGFDTGFAMGLGVPVIWSCRKDHIGKLDFDIRKHNCIAWKTPGKLAAQLQKRIEATLGKGPKTVLGDHSPLVSQPSLDTPQPDSPTPARPDHPSTAPSRHSPSAPLNDPPTWTPGGPPPRTRLSDPFVATTGIRDGLSEVRRSGPPGVRNDDPPRERTTPSQGRRPL